MADLDAKQIAVASMVARAWPDKKIAATLKISDRMVRFHITAIAFLCKFDPTYNTRIQLAMWYREHVPVTEKPVPPQALDTIPPEIL